MMIWQDRNMSECFKVFYVKLYAHSLVDELKWFYENARCYNKSYNVYWSSCKVPVILVTFHDRFSINTQISNVMKIDLVVTEMFRAQGRTWQTAIFLIMAILIRPLVAEGGKEIGQLCDVPSWDYQFGWRGWGGMFQPPLHSCANLMTDFPIHCRVFWHYWWMKFHSSSRSVSRARGFMSTGDVNVLGDTEISTKWRQ